MARILVVDNDEGLVHFLRRLFAKAGYDVATCTDGMAALSALRQEVFDVILLDYKMPGLNGLDTLSEIKRLQVRTPVILMTAFGTSETAIEAMKRGAYDYLLKPFDTEELKRITADALQVSRLMREVVTLPAPLSPISPVAGELRLVGNNRRFRKYSSSSARWRPRT